MRRVIYFDQEKLAVIRAPDGVTEFMAKPMYGGLFGYGEWAMVAMQYPFSNLIEMRYFVAHRETGFPIGGCFPSKAEAAEAARHVLKNIDRPFLTSLIAEHAANMAAADKRLADEERARRKQAHQERDPDREREQAGHVYLIRCGELYKIGKAADVGARLRGMSLPSKPEIVATAHFPKPYNVERELHRKYKHCRENGEWFRLKADEVEQVKTRLAEKPKLHAVA